jgi:hypothetical protein
LNAIVMSNKMYLKNYTIIGVLSLFIVYNFYLYVKIVDAERFGRYEKFIVASSVSLARGGGGSIFVSRTINAKIFKVKANRDICLKSRIGDSILLIQKGNSVYVPKLNLLQKKRELYLLCTAFFILVIWKLWVQVKKDRIAKFKKD